MKNKKHGVYYSMQIGGNGFFLFYFANVSCYKLLYKSVSRDRSVQMAEKKCSCGCGCDSGKTREYNIPAEEKQCTLADLPVGTKATIVKIMPKARGSKKFADVGIVPGSELLIEAHAPFGGLIRVKVMETSMAIHKDEAANIVIEEEPEE